MAFTLACYGAPEAKLAYLALQIGDAFAMQSHQEPDIPGATWTCLSTELMFG